MMSSVAVLCLVVLLALSSASAFTAPGRILSRRQMQLQMVDVTFPNKKKVSVEKGSPLKDAAKKAGFKPKYAW